MIFYIVVVIAVLFLSFIGTAGLRSYALRNNVIDIPNERSSHHTPTPRGGGMAIIASLMLGLLLSVVANADLWTTCVVLLITTSGVAFIGFLDDHGHVNSMGRLAVHFSAAIIMVVWVEGLPSLTMFGHIVDFGWAGGVLAVLGIVWMLNLNNFMDGIDGIASVQSISVALGMMACMWLSVEITPLFWWWGGLASAVCGFLCWNFPPAKIFMGDAGSGGLGFFVGALLLLSAHLYSDLLWCGLILFGVFIVDATYTLIVRLLAGHKLYEAHRSHCYQKASRIWQGHKPVTLMVTFINGIWLLPWALLVASGYMDGALALTASYLPLIFVAYKLNAGHDYPV
jgi:Fuc2NAc and GlcNAc transferase